MGNRGSKSDECTENNLSNNCEGSQSTSPISTPQIHYLDPRSPSNNISRTPLELLLSSNSNSLPNYNSIYAECSTDSPTIRKILDCDPRSPTTEYDRTPIIVNTIKKSYPRNKNLDVVCKLHNYITPIKSNKKQANIIPPKLLESSPISINQININKRKSLVGLLETNIDFTETDLDHVMNTSYLSKSLPSKTTDASFVDDENRTETDIPASILVPSSNEMSFKFNDDYSNNGSEEIVCNEQDNIDEVDDKNVNNIEECDRLPQEQFDDTNENRNEISIKETLKCEKNKVINITANVKDLDKKLSNLIYEDDDDDDDNDDSSSHIINQKLIEKNKDINRTPLGIRNTNDKIKESKLKVSDKPRKLDYAVSKIPVFRKKMHVQCENTPPRHLRTEHNIKSKKSHWDGDITLVI